MTRCDQTCPNRHPQASDKPVTLFVDRGVYIIPELSVEDCHGCQGGTIKINVGSLDFCQIQGTHGWATLQEEMLQIGLRQGGHQIHGMYQQILIGRLTWPIIQMSGILELPLGQELKSITASWGNTRICNTGGFMSL